MVFVRVLAPCVTTERVRVALEEALAVKGRVRLTGAHVDLKLHAGVFRAEELNVPPGHADGLRAGAVRPARGGRKRVRGTQIPADLAGIDTDQAQRRAAQARLILRDHAARILDALPRAEIAGCIAHAGRVAGISPPVSVVEVPRVAAFRPCHAATHAPRRVATAIGIENRGYGRFDAKTNQLLRIPTGGGRDAVTGIVLKHVVSRARVAIQTTSAGPALPGGLGIGRKKDAGVRIHPGHRAAHQTGARIHGESLLSDDVRAQFEAFEAGLRLRPHRSVPQGQQRLPFHRNRDEFPGAIDAAVLRPDDLSAHRNEKRRVTARPGRSADGRSRLHDQTDDITGLNERLSSRLTGSHPGERFIVKRDVIGALIEVMRTRGTQ